MREYNILKYCNIFYLYYGIGLTPLAIAIRLKKYAIALDLIRSGCHMSKSDFEGFTPLYHAAINNDLRAVKLLLDCGLRTSENGSVRRSAVWQNIARPILNFIQNHKYVHYNKK